MPPRSSDSTGSLGIDQTWINDGFALSTVPAANRDNEDGTRKTRSHTTKRPAGPDSAIMALGHGCVNASVPTGCSARRVDDHAATASGRIRCGGATRNDDRARQRPRQAHLLGATADLSGSMPSHQRL